MDEFDKIREFSEDIANRKEPTLSLDVEVKEEVVEPDDASLYDFTAEYAERPAYDPMNDSEEKKFSSMKLHIIALAIFIGILALILIGFFAFGEKADNSDEIVTISATQEPVKVRPEQPGGMNIPDQDKLVYNRIRTNNIDTKVESLFPEPEKPVVPTILAIENNAPDTAFVSMEEVKSFNPLADMPSVSIQETPKVEEVPLKKEAPKKITKPKPTPAVVKTTKVATPAKAADGIWSAQLMSSSTREAVEKAWPSILAKNKALLSNMSYQIAKADIPGKGTFYRLRVGNFKTRDMANELCTKLKARKQDCIPAK